MSPYGKQPQNLKLFYSRFKLYSLNIPELAIQPVLINQWCMFSFWDPTAWLYIWIFSYFKYHGTCISHGSLLNIFSRCLSTHLRNIKLLNHTKYFGYLNERERLASPNIIHYILQLIFGKELVIIFMKCINILLYVHNFLQKVHSPLFIIWAREKFNFLLQLFYINVKDINTNQILNKSYILSRVWIHISMN